METLHKVINVKQYQARYSIETVRENKRIFSRDRFSSISFENQGDVDATINGIPCTNNGVVREFNELPNTTIDSDFIVTFDPNTLGTNPNILVIKTYYTENIDTKYM